MVLSPEHAKCCAKTKNIQGTQGGSWVKGADNLRRQTGLQGLCRAG